MQNINLGLQLSSYAFTVGDVEEEPTCPTLRVVRPVFVATSSSEPAPKMAAIPEPVPAFKMATTEFPALSTIATFPEPVPKMATSPESAECQCRWLVSQICKTRYSNAFCGGYSSVWSTLCSSVSPYFSAAHEPVPSPLQEYVLKQVQSMSPFLSPVKQQSRSLTQSSSRVQSCVKQHKAWFWCESG